MNAPRRQLAGLTLIEVLLAMVIMSTVLVGLITVASRGLSVIGLAGHFETVRQLSGQVDVESPLRLKDEIQNETETGTFEDAPGGWSWSRQIVHLGDEDEQQEGLFEVTIQIRWSEGMAGRGYEEYKTLLYVPENNLGERTLKPAI